MNNVSSVHSNVFFPNSAQCVLTLEDLLDLGQVNQSSKYNALNHALHNPPPVATRQLQGQCLYCGLYTDTLTVSSHAVTAGNHSLLII